MVQLEEAIEGDDGAGGAQLGAFIVGDFDGDLVEFGGLHLRGDGALPDEFVQAALVVVQMRGDVVRAAVDVGGADGFVGLLGVLGAADVFARRAGEVIGAVGGLDVIADAGDRLAGHLHAVGAHVGDQPGGLAVEFHAFVQLLRQAHGLLRAEAELSRRFLLQGGGGEGRRRVALDALALDRSDSEAAGLDGRLGSQSKGLVVEVELRRPAW